MDAPVIDRTSPHPRIEDRGDGHAQLVMRLLGEIFAVAFGKNNALIRVDHFLQVRWRQIGVIVAAGAQFYPLQYPLKFAAFHPHHNMAKHGDEAAIGIKRKTTILG